MFFHFRQGYYLLHTGDMEQFQETRIADTMTYMRIILSRHKVDEQILLNSPTCSCKSAVSFPRGLPSLFNWRESVCPH